MRQDSTQAYRSSMPAWAAVGSEVEVGGAPPRRSTNFVRAASRGRTRVHISGDKFHRLLAGPPHLNIPDFGYAARALFR